MSELKAVTSGEIYNIIEYEDCYRTDDIYYLKSEADDVIAEKDEKIDELQKATDSAWSKVNTMYDELRHQKYKRCMAMVKWCRSRARFYDTMRGESLYWAWKSDRAYKWHERWLDIAEKFKEVGR